MSRLEILDWSTINLDVLQKQPIQKMPPTYRLQKDCGNGCSGDPPGYPSYFTRSVYTQFGNNPPHNWPGYNLVIEYMGTCYGIRSNNWEPKETWEKRGERQDKLFARLWNKPAINHPRTVAWILTMFMYYSHCYQDPTVTGDWHKKMLIFPVPKYKLRQFQDDLRFSDEWRTSEQATVDCENAEIMGHARKVASWNNHCAVIQIRTYYPEFVETAGGFSSNELLQCEFERPGNWWETMAKRPSPTECPGQYNRKHPCNGSWCQMCGW